MTYFVNLGPPVRYFNDVYMLKDEKRPYLGLIAVVVPLRHIYTHVREGCSKNPVSGQIITSGLRSTISFPFATVQVISTFDTEVTNICDKIWDTDEGSELHSM